MTLIYYILSRFSGFKSKMIFPVHLLYIYILFTSLKNKNHKNYIIYFIAIIFFSFSFLYRIFNIHINLFLTYIIL